MTPVDDDTLQQIRERLQVSSRVGAERIQVAGTNGDVILRGRVATPEEVAVAGQLAEVYATSVINELVVDRGLREGAEAPPAGEPAVPPEEEELVGSTDMLSGPETEPTQDLAEALDENAPWSPPDVPQETPTRVEERRGLPQEQTASEPLETEGGERPADLEPDDWLTEPEPAEAGEAETAEPPLGADEEEPAAPDVSAAELRQARDGGALPALDPTAAPPSEEPEPDPYADEETGGGTGEDMVGQVAGTPKGPGAVGERTTGGGTTGGTPAAGTRAAGADTAPEDPAQGPTGGTRKSAGTDRGPTPPGAEEDLATEEELADEERAGEEVHRDE